MLDKFTQAYIECALWSSTDSACSCDAGEEAGDGHTSDCGRNTGGEPLDTNYSVEDIDPKCLASMVKDCADFQEAQAELLEGMDPEQAGHDFWLTRNRHGAGFWDRGLGELGDALTKASELYGSMDLYTYDGKIYGL